MNTSSREVHRHSAHAVDGARLLFATQELKASASHEAAALRSSQDRCDGGVHARSDWFSLSQLRFFCYVSFLLLTIPSVCAVIIAEGVVGIRRVPHLQQPCACIRMGDRYGKTKKGSRLPL